MTADRPLALVTGASSGIGKATAHALAEAGFDVVGTSRKVTAGDSRGGVTFLSLDVTRDDSVESVVQQVIEKFGRIDVLVNNAGIGANGAAEEISAAQAQRIFEVNVFGLMRMTKAVLPHMRRQGRGRIINISSVIGFVPNPFMAVYVATKHAVEGYSESVDHEVREQGIRVLRVQPGPINTPFDVNMMQADTPLPIYARQRAVFDELMEEQMRSGDDPAVVAKVVVAAATDPKPKLSYPAGSIAARVSVLRRIVPARAFDKSVRKLNRMTS
ncbi:oxidoreductase [Streptomyces coeruleorubidus]|uniref:Oxidoreductase n=1 Tax=Streptomyces coeruleorubidus TaxID=116188 RepID=A0A5J6IDL2_STRC4|nr:oxidoreductase [Streptomyces coeruleorubidus]QEV28970.1 oxidoreductase [Streptomyces coeruleorubidus]GGU13018.1 short-chain dehydrogenase/reductase [Streptomyces coeruleorubidus]